MSPKCPKISHCAFLGLSEQIFSLLIWLFFNAIILDLAFFRDRNCILILKRCENGWICIESFSEKLWNVRLENSFHGLSWERALQRIVVSVALLPSFLLTVNPRFLRSYSFLDFQHILARKFKVSELLKTDFIFRSFGAKIQK